MGFEGTEEEEIRANPTTRKKNGTDAHGISDHPVDVHCILTSVLQPGCY